MKPDKLHDAINHLDDDLIEAADKLRSAPRSVRAPSTHGFAVAACAVMVAALTLITIKFMPSLLNTSPDGAHITKSTDDFNEMVTDITGTNDGNSNTDDGAVDVNKNGVTIPETIITENTLGEYFCYEGRIYVPYREMTNVEANEVIGEELGTLKNVFKNAAKENSDVDYYADFSTNMDYGDKVFTLKGFDKEFMLAVWLDTHFHIFINDNGMTLTKGSDILVDRLNLLENYTAIKMSISGSSFYQETIPSYEYEPINDFIELCYDTPIVSQVENKNLFIEATLVFTLSSGVDVRIHLYEDNYIAVEMGELSRVCLKADTSKLNHSIFDDFVEYLKTSSFGFNYEKFMEHIPTPDIERYMFCHKIFASNMVLYFYSDAHIWPEELVNAPIRYDKSSLKVYYTNDCGQTISTVILPLPEDFDTSYDTIIPVYSGSGAGSGEFEVIYRVEYSDEVRYISFNNFAWSSRLFEFEYGGEVSEERMKNLRENSTQDVHVYELLTEIIHENPAGSDENPPRGSATGIYRIKGEKVEPVAEIDYFISDSYSAVLKVLGITRGRNFAYSYPDSLKFVNVSYAPVSLDDTYFVHTKDGDLILTYDETVNILTQIGLIAVRLHEPVAYNVEGYRYEQVSDSKHNRSVNIIKINTYSAHSGAILQTLTTKFDTILSDYMNSAPYEHQSLLIDSTHCKVGEFLIAATIAKTPSQYTTPHVFEGIIWNLAEDKLYTPAEYLDAIGIKSLASVGATVEEKFGDGYTSAVLGIFYLNGDIYFVVNVYSNFENGVNSAETMFYNYSTSELILGANFSGFASLSAK